MLIRALIVVLAILNAGVALWWWRSPPVSDAPVPAMSPPDGVPVLQLRAEQPELPAPAADPAADTAATAPAPAAAKPAVAVAAAAEPAPVTATASAEPPAPPAVCVSLGPFAERALLDQARTRAGAMFQAARPRELAAASGGNASYRVMLPPAASREAAQATVKRIVAAGISDYFIIGQGDLANAVALGQFRNRDGAQRRLDQLQEAGFPAQIVSSEAAASRWWLDARLAAGSSAAQARQASGSERVQSLDCKVFALD